MSSRLSFSGAPLCSLGFDSVHEEALGALHHDPPLSAARVIAQDGELVRLAGAADLGEPSGRLRYLAAPLELPVIGDWVAVDASISPAVIHHLLPRRTLLVRRAAGRTGQSQAVAANVDVCFIVTSANRDANARRVERYVAAVSDSGARAVLVVNKADLCPPPQRDELVRALSACAPGVPVLLVSAATGEGLDALAAAMTPAPDSPVPTVAFIGMSGVGKSSLVNALLGEAHQLTLPINAEDRGRHTTTRRELFALPTGALVIDTPGMRLLGLVTDEGGLDDAFPDVAAHAAECRFTDCHHLGEPGCAIEAALATGELSLERLAAWQKLHREVAAAHERQAHGPASRSKQWSKQIHRDLRARRKVDPKLRE